MKSTILLSLLGLAFISTSANTLKTTSTPYLTNYQSSTDTVKIVFQLSVADTMAHKALMKQLGNITSVEPNVRIEVVCHGPGLDMLRNDKSTVAEMVASFSKKGVVFNACEFSMKERNVTHQQILPSAKFVKAGILYIVSKQQAGWSYIKSGF